MKKNTSDGIFKVAVLSLLLVIAALLALLVSKNSSFIPDRLKNLFISNTKLVASSPSPVLTSSPTPTPKPRPEYSVTFLTRPDVSNMYSEPFFVDVKIKNISAKPFITGLSVSNCSFIDGTNISRQSSTQLGGGIHFQKAITPGEERVLTHQQLSLDASGMSGLNAKGQICGYDANGNYGCEMVKGLKIVSCEVSISGVPDSLQMKVNFP